MTNAIRIDAVVAGCSRGLAEFFMAWDSNVMAGELYPQTTKTLTSSAVYLGSPEAVSQSQVIETGMVTITGRWRHGHR